MRLWAMNPSNVREALNRVYNGDDPVDVLIDLYEHPDTQELTVHEITEVRGRDLPKSVADAGAKAYDSSAYL